MFIALQWLVIPLRQERHVTEHANHIALRWSAELLETRGYKHRAPPEQLATQTNLNRLLVQSRGDQLYTKGRFQFG